MTGRRWAQFATLAAWVCAVWVPVHGVTARPNGEGSERPTLDATAWLSTLPGVLTPPSVPPGWQLLSVIADDIDADGDLDLVANDGSLDLIVWINDGTGHLSRQHGGKPSRSPQKMSGPTFSDQPPGSQAVAHTAFFVLHEDSSFGSDVTIGSRRPFGGPTDPSMTLLVSARSPRAPPLSFLAN